jgi:hypothetical protein
MVYIHVKVEEEYISEQVERCTVGGVYSISIYTLSTFALILSSWLALNRSCPELMKADISGEPFSLKVCN